MKSKLYNCVFIGDVKSIASSHNVTIGYKTLTENRWKKKCGTQVSKFTGHPFPTEEMILIEVVSKGKEERLFVVVCSDGNNTYLILQRNFHLEKFVLGISQKSCNWDTFESSKRWGNTGLVGEYIFKVNSPCNETGLFLTRLCLNSFHSVACSVNILYYNRQFEKIIRPFK